MVINAGLALAIVSWILFLTALFPSPARAIGAGALVHPPLLFMASSTLSLLGLAAVATVAFGRREAWRARPLRVWLSLLMAVAPPAAFLIMALRSALAG